MDQYRGFAVGANVFVIKNRKLLLGQRKNIIGESDWGLPGGHLEFGESIVAAAKRELQEETGLQADAFDFVNLVNDPQMRGHYLQVGFIACGIHGEPELKEPDRCAEWKWFAEAELPKNIFRAHRKQIEAFYRKGAAFVDSE